MSPDGWTVVHLEFAAGVGWFRLRDKEDVPREGRITRDGLGVTFRWTTPPPDGVEEHYEPWLLQRFLQEQKARYGL